MADKSSQTEKPTQRKIEQARKEGRFLSSREAVSALQFLAFVAMIGSFGAGYCRGVMETARYLMKSAFTMEVTPAELMRVVHVVVVRNILPLGVLGAVLLVVSLGAQMAVSRLGLSGKGLKPNFGRLNPINKLKEMPRNNLPLLLQAIVLLPLFGLAVWGIVKDNWDALMRMPLQGLETGTRQMAVSLQSLLWKGAMLFVVMGAIDYIRQSRRYTTDLMMSKQEIRDEAKEMEGNPQIKGKIRQLRREWLRRRMTAAVPTATAVVVNPTHYAVAIRYTVDSMAAPMVVAKGRNYLALRIRKKALEHQVPIIENPPLARALFKTAEVGQEIPAHLYRAVAEILAYIYRIMGGRLPA